MKIKRKYSLLAVLLGALTALLIVASTATAGLYPKLPPAKYPITARIFASFSAWAKQVPGTVCVNLKTAVLCQTSVAAVVLVRPTYCTGVYKVYWRRGGKLVPTTYPAYTSNLCKPPSGQKPIVSPPAPPKPTGPGA